ncbi:hypothetical protein EV188_112130 [Actinomycetospora succinea]|uniref:Uncharacterized protein n=1 Tax=Actinomycetospora succinea TaxID=663603 RepID=A0A4R6ULF6_9PSEU|nr:hypothetical protein EV188_112130 [Actinomycetospora succinea]
MSPAKTSAHTSEAPEAPGEGAIDPELLRLIQRVAHREHLLDGTVAPRVRTTADSSSTRRRPAIGSVRTRATRGTTARKVTWS